MGHCFYCDEPVDGDTCPTCGRPVWTETPSPPSDANSSGVAPARRPDRPEITGRHIGDSPPPPSSASPDPHPRSPRLRLSVAVAVVLIAALAIIAIPSGFERTTTPSAPSPTTTTTTTTTITERASVSNLGEYSLPTSTFVGVLGPDSSLLLNTNAVFLHPSPGGGSTDLGVLADGSTLRSVDGDLVRSVPDGHDVPIDSPGTTLDTAVSPDGLRVAIRNVDGALSVWNAPTQTFTALPPADPRGPAGSMHWSPDSTLLGVQTSDDEFLLVDVASPEAPRTISPGVLLGVGNAALAVRNTEGSMPGTIRLVGLDRDALSFIPFEPALRETIYLEGTTKVAFDPTGLMLAADGSRAGQAGLRVVPLSGAEERFVGDDPIDFSWSGDGSVLFWIDDRSVNAYPTSSPSGQGQVAGGRFEPGAKLFVYDPAILPVPAPLLEGDEYLAELRDGLVMLRTPDGLTDVAPGHDLPAVSLQPFGAELLRTVAENEGVTLRLTDPGTGITDTAEGDVLEPDERIVGAIMNQPSLHLGFLETDRGRILMGPGQGQNGSFQRVADGSSLGKIGAYVFALATDQRRLLALSLPPATTASTEDEGFPLLLDANRLPNAERLITAAGVGTDLLAVAQLDTGEHVLYFIPGYSSVFSVSLPRSAPAEAHADWLQVWIAPRDWTDLQFAGTPAGNLAVLAAHTPDGPVSLLIEDPSHRQSRCGTTPCILDTIDGRPLGLSPGGDWLIVDRDGQEVAVSTRGRGERRIDTVAPDEIAWIPER